MRDGIVICNRDNIILEKPNTLALARIIDHRIMVPSIHPPAFSYREGGRERERERERQRQRQRARQTDRQTQTNKQTNKQTNEQTN